VKNVKTYADHFNETLYYRLCRIRLDRCDFGDMMLEVLRCCFCINGVVDVQAKNNERQNAETSRTSRNRSPNQPHLLLKSQNSHHSNRLKGKTIRRTSCGRILLPVQLLTVANHSPRSAHTSQIRNEGKQIPTSEQCRCCGYPTVDILLEMAAGAVQ
jgi:hypothetical protein